MEILYKITQRPAEGKLFEVKPLEIDRSKFEKPMSDRNREWTRRVIQDAFAHEQCLVICENHETVLLSGCAHNGILNILEAYQERFEGMPDKVISGFHMVKKGDYTPKEIETIEDTARELKKMGIRVETRRIKAELPMS